MLSKGKKPVLIHDAFHKALPSIFPAVTFVADAEMLRDILSGKGFKILCF